MLAAEDNIRKEPASNRPSRVSLGTIGLLLAFSIFLLYDGYAQRARSNEEAQEKAAEAHACKLLEPLGGKVTHLSDQFRITLMAFPSIVETIDGKLVIHKPKITDDGLVHLKKLSHLQTLDLTDTQITDAGLEHLKGLTKLEYLKLTRTQVTDAGVADLQKALPNCKISP